MTTYEESGVNLVVGNSLSEFAREQQQKTWKNVRVVNGLPLVHIGDHCMLTATDGVGTKLKLYLEHPEHLHNAGKDLVAMCVNDLIRHGFKGSAFSCYYDQSKLDDIVYHKVLSGVADACIEAGVSLIAGETAEMPGFYNNGLFDLVGTAIGFKLYHKVYPKTMNVGDVLIGVESNGVHSNGFSLINSLVETGRLDISDPETVKQLLAPTEIYLPLLEVYEKYDNWINCGIHITGGGLLGKLESAIPSNMSVNIELNEWYISSIFDVIRDASELNDYEMYNIFNMGIGMVFVVDKYMANAIVGDIENVNYIARVLGELKPRIDLV